MIYEISDKNHPMFGLVFSGHLVDLSGEKRIWNDETLGQSYPESSCDCVHPSYLKAERFPIPVKIFHSNTGHIYVKPVSNLKPFTEDDEEVIIEVLGNIRLNTVRSKVNSNYTLSPIEKGYGFRVY